MHLENKSFRVSFRNHWQVHDTYRGYACSRYRVQLCVERGVTVRGHLGTVQVGLVVLPATYGP
jgi:hypothetical protein